MKTRLARGKSGSSKSKRTIHPTSGRSALAVSRGRFRVSHLDASRLRRAEVDSRGDRQDERMSRRSSRYKGGVTRGREEQPQGNSTMKRGSPTTKKAGSKSNTAARGI